MQKMIDIYTMTDDREQKLWKEAVFIFDSSALLDFYFLPKKTREKVYMEVFERMPNRLWIPAHVRFEYLKNREKVIRKPIQENFLPLEEDVKKTKVKVNEVLKHLTSIIDMTKKDDKHPHIEQTKISKFNEALQEFITKADEFEKEFLEQIELAKNDVISVEKNDDVFEAIEKYFKTGQEFTFEQILEITKEGKHRFEFKIPPGYGDLYKGEKKGTQIFGDLIIWKQIIEYSKENQLPVIFITNDISKDDDWCYIDKKKKIISPREELIKEIHDATNVEFWLYSQPDFLFYSNKYLDATIEDSSIRTASCILSNKISDQSFLRFRCSKCQTIHTIYKKDMLLDFLWVDGNARNMGSENRYEAIENFECECGNHIEAVFTIWEYPLGVHNHHSVDLYGASLMNTFDFTMNFHNEKCGDITCDLCGAEFDKERTIYLDGVGYICPFHEIHPDNKRHND